MKEVLKLLNQLVAADVISSYAIGGSIAAFFYIEATHTEDVDAFTIVPKGGLLLTLEPIYDAAKKLGAVVQGEHLQVGNWKLQLLPPRNALVEEALKEARTVKLYGVSTRVMDAEHLCAIMVDTGRPKDKLRLHEFVKANKVNLEELTRLCEKFNLTRKLEAWLKELKEHIEDESEVAASIRAIKIPFREFVGSLSWQEKIKVVERLQLNAKEIRKIRVDLNGPFL